MSFNTPQITTADVKAISSLAGNDLSVFIGMSVAFVDEVLGDKGLSNNMLRLIAINIAAHFGFLKEGQVKSETLGPTSETFNMESGQGLASTTFGQQAIMLDSSKTLAKLNDPKRNTNKPVFKVF
jgi:hypothetical protein